MKCFPTLLRRPQLLLLLLVCPLLGCNSATSPSRETQAAAPNKYEEYADALAAAESGAANDEFERYLSDVGSISIAGEDILHLNRFRVARDGSILVCDFERKVVLRFDSQGKNKTTIGTNDNAPGGYVFPTDVVETKDSSIAIPDFQGYRVNLFGMDGTFRSSFIFSPQSFSAQQLIVNDQNDSFYLFGNRWQYDGDGNRIGADLIHKYTASGDYLGSFLDFPERFKALDLYNNSFTLSDIADGTVYTMLPFDYSIYQLSSDDKLSVFLKGGTKDYREPQTKLDSQKAPRSESYQVFQEWALTHTPLVALVVSGDKLFVEYQTFNPLRYTIDIWSRSTRKLTGTFRTNRLLLGRGEGNSLYFLNNIEARMQHEYVISKAEPK